jgi:hypothetical protein
MKERFKPIIKFIVGPDPRSHYIEINFFEWFLWFVIKRTTPTSNASVRSIYVVTNFVDESPMMDTGRRLNISWLRNFTLYILCFKICWTWRYYQSTLRRVYGTAYDHTADSRAGQKMRMDILDKVEYWND